VGRVHSAGFFLFVTFLAISFAFRKAFCSWLCPVGSLSEYLWRLGRFIFRSNFQLPRWADLSLRSLKYLLLGFFAYAIANMSAEAIAEFMGSPYALIVDVRMLNFFRYLSGTAAYVVLGLVIASMFVQNFWCRYLMSLWGVARLCLNAQSGADQPRREHLHRLCEVREGLPLVATCGHARANSLGRMHRLSGMCGGVPGKRYAHCNRTICAEEAACHPCVGHGCRHRTSLLRPGRLCQVVRTVEHYAAKAHLFAACSFGGRTVAPRVESTTSC